MNGKLRFGEAQKARRRRAALCMHNHASVHAQQELPHRGPTPGQPPAAVPRLVNGNVRLRQLARYRLCDIIWVPAALATQLRISTRD